MKIVDISGQKFGRLTALERSGVRNGNAIWLCACDCGGTKEAILSNLKNKITQSCGCLRADAYKSRKPYKHGYGRRKLKDPTYTTWEAMRARCNNPNSDWFHRYGGRGIRVCERWNDFTNFLNDMGPRSSGKTIDRIDVNGNYEPKNCRWATPKEQASNKAAK